jgi:anti-sigma regulatory factor (Ser/Thr protein kinase)
LEEPTLARMKGPTAHLLLPCRSESVHTVRALLRRDLERWQVSEEMADSIQLAIAEAVTNAVVNGAWAQRDPVLVMRWSLDDGLFTFSVQDRGPGVDTSVMAMSRRAHPSQNRGRGLYVMQAVMDRVVVDSSLNGTRILLEKSLEAPSPVWRRPHPSGPAGWSGRYWDSPGCASCMAGHIRSSSASALISLSG